MERIVLDPEIRRGLPTVAGTRLTVAEVLGELALGHTLEQVLHLYPQLAREDVLACLAWAANRDRETWVLRS